MLCKKSRSRIDHWGDKISQKISSADYTLCNIFFCILHFLKCHSYNTSENIQYRDQLQDTLWSKKKTLLTQNILTNKSTFLDWHFLGVWIFIDLFSYTVCRTVFPILDLSVKRCVIFANHRVEFCKKCETDGASSFMQFCTDVLLLDCSFTNCMIIFILAKLSRPILHMHFNRLCIPMLSMWTFNSCST